MLRKLDTKRILFLRKHKPNAIVGRLILRDFLDKIKPRWPWRFDFTGWLVWKLIQVITHINCHIRKHEVAVSEYHGVVYRRCELCDRTWVIKC